MRLKIIFVLTMTFTNLSLAQTWRSQGEVRLELRQFQDDDSKTTTDEGQAVFARVEARRENPDGVEVVLRGFSRADRRDKERNLMALEDAYARYSFGAEKQWQLLGGYQIFAWNATEAFYPADVINSRNFDSDLESPEKLGEMTFSLTRSIERGELNFYFWPRYERPHYPGRQGRLGYGVDLERVRFLDNDESNDDWGPQFGANIKRSFESFDLMLFAVHHINRNTVLVGNHETVAVPLNISPCGSTLCPKDGIITRPYLFQATEIGGTISYVWSDLIIKLEGAARNFDQDHQILTLNGLQTPPDYQEAALGFEYAYTHLSGYQSTLFFENNAILGIDKTRRALLSAFQRDYFLGYRLSINDEDGKEIMFGMIGDYERANEYFYNLRYAQRLNNEWSIKTGLRIYDAPKKGTLPVGLEVLDEDNQVFLNISRFF